jgi:hypothetical protein
MNIWLYILIGGFAALGLTAFIRGVVKLWKTIVGTATDLASTLKDATEIARAYREDLAILRELAQFSPTPNSGSEPKSIIPEQSSVQSAMPPAYFDRFAAKPYEPDAEPESVVDLTPSDEEIIASERDDVGVDLEAVERQKAATRDADLERLRELSGEAK